MMHYVAFHCFNSVISDDQSSAIFWLLPASALKEEKKCMDVPNQAFLIAFLLPSSTGGFRLPNWDIFPCLILPCPPLPSRPSPPLRSKPVKSVYSQEVCLGFLGSAVGSGVWGRATAEIELGAF